jgi:ribosomal protein S14
MDGWAWERPEPWLEVRRELPIGAVLCVIHRPTADRHWEASAARRTAAPRGGPRRCSAPGSRRTGFAMLTLSRWRAREFSSS